MSSCGNNKTKLYPNKSYFESDNLYELDLVNLIFKEISKSVNKIHIKDSLPFIQIENVNTTNKIGVLRNDSGHLRRSHVLSVGKDSVYVDDGYSINKLSFLMKRHYENNGKNPLYPLNDKVAIIEIALNPNEKYLELVKSLKLITSTFDKLNKHHNDSLSLRIILKREVPPPPPAPLREE